MSLKRYIKLKTIETNFENCSANKFSLITVAIRFILLQGCPSRRASFCMCCVIYTLFSCFERLFLCFAQFGGISYCLNFDKFPDTASLSSRRKQPTFGDATTGFPAKWHLRNEHRNSILMTHHYPDLGSASDWLNQISHAARPIRSTAQIWVVTRHQYGISVLVSQTSFRGETSGGVAKCRLFSQAKKFLDFVAGLSNRTIFVR